MLPARSRRRVRSRAPTCPEPVGPGIDAPKGAPCRVAISHPRQGLVDDVVEGDRLPAREAMVEGYYQHPGLLVEDRVCSWSVENGSRVTTRPPGGPAVRHVVGTSPGAGFARRRRGARDATRAPPG